VLPDLKEGAELVLFPFARGSTNRVDAGWSCDVLVKLSPHDQISSSRQAVHGYLDEEQDYLQKSIENLLWRCSERVLAERTMMGRETTEEVSSFY
jgi:hypothetical protein